MSLIPFPTPQASKLAPNPVGDCTRCDSCEWRCLASTTHFWDSKLAVLHCYLRLVCRVLSYGDVYCIFHAASVLRATYASMRCSFVDGAVLASVRLLAVEAHPRRRLRGLAAVTHVLRNGGVRSRDPASPCHAPVWVVLHYRVGPIGFPRPLYTRPCNPSSSLSIPLSVSILLLNPAVLSQSYWCSRHCLLSSSFRAYDHLPCL